MKNRSLYSVLTRFGIVAAVLTALLVIAPAVSAADPVVIDDYEENSTDDVASFSATDEDGDAIEWSLGGEHASSFTIPGGVLKFKSPPDYEVQNSYSVTVKATGGSLDVTVKIVNLNEPGTVSFDKPQPQAGRGLVATAKDPDGAADDQEWQWAKSMDGETGWMDITGATAASRDPAASDVGYYLQATVTYTDMFGEGQTASAVTDRAVEARTTANAAPSFSDHDPEPAAPDVFEVARELEEGTAAETNIGDPVAAADSDNDILLYSIVEDVVDGATQTDDEKFDIDSRTGQLKVKIVLDFEPEGSQVGDDQEYVVVIRATDPSGAMGDATVTITLLDVNEAPMFAATAPTTVYVTENTTELRTAEAVEPASPLGNYVTMDDDGTADTTAYDVVGADKDNFEISQGALTIVEGHNPNFELMPSYSISITATDSNTTDDSHMALTSTLPVTVMVVDAEDTGEVSFVQREPQVDKTITAKVSDPDGGVTNTTWQWMRVNQESDNVCPAGGFTAIVGETSPSYTPKAEDVDFCLQAMATYEDNILTEAQDGDGIDDPTNEGNTTATVMERPVQPDSPANAAPKFPDQDADTSGDQSDSTTREVAENTKAGTAFGVEIEATDPTGDLLIHTLGGDDSDSFGIDRINGQLKTKAALNYEEKDTYSVTITATDPSGAPDTIAVTINITDENDNAVITGDDTIDDYPENGTDPVASYSATDEDGDAIVWSVDNDTFDISEDGVLTFASPPDFEKASSHTVMVKATGGAKKLTVNIADMNEPGTAKLNKPQPQATRGLMATFTEPDGGGDTEDEMWQWAKSMDGETGWMDIEGGDVGNPFAG